MDGKPNLLGAMVYEVREFRYAVANKPFADIQILVFQNGQFGGQAIILRSKKKISTGEAYNSLEETLEKINALIEDEIKDDEWVIQTAQGIKKYQNI